jgi:hypothetical protein
MVFSETHADIEQFQFNASKHEATIQWRNVVARMALRRFHLIPPECNRHRVECDRLDVASASVGRSANDTILVDDRR